jgi:hypothetical protein
MAYARVVTFEDVDADRMQDVRRQISGGERPEGLPASEMMLLHDPASNRAIAVMFFDSEADYAQGDRALDAMPADATPGRRSSVGRYEVVVRVTA